ncbi:MAG: hypothetical protein Q4D76_17500 [Oscillospiraceae bacterium]|nr:hypothetical protein [Oscillospiraceae bacterium]
MTFNSRSNNEAVLSPYVPVGFSRYKIEEDADVKELINIKHKNKPVLLCYSDETADNSERFRKNSALLVEKIMRGFLSENSMSILNMWLVDFESLYFPESRTKGFLKVLRTQQEVQNLYIELQKNRNLVDSFDDGKISTINPKKIKMRDNPIKYNIVFFVGVDFSSMDQETVQLFISGENFGFLPILFMRQKTASDMLAEEGNRYMFSKVIKKIKELEQVYSYENVLNEFEYDVMVSNQKKELEEKAWVNKIMSFAEFMEIAYSDAGMSIDRNLYVDTYQISEDLYIDLSEYDSVRFFTINDVIPDFVCKDVEKI